MRRAIGKWVGALIFLAAACGPARGPLEVDGAASGGSGGASGGSGGKAPGTGGGHGGSGGSGGATGGTGGVPTGGPGGIGGTGGILLTPSASGYVDGTNAAGVIGAWYAFADGYGDGASVPGAGACQTAGHTDCSSFFTPTPNLPFAPSASGQMCTSGHAAKVPPTATGVFDYANVFGAEIALDLNAQPGPNGGILRQPYDPIDRMPSIRGISFDIDNPPTNSLRVELPTAAVVGHTDADAAWWGGGTQNASPVKPGRNIFLWPDVGGPLYLPSPPAFDPRKILSIRFHVITNTSAPVDFKFCIANLTFLTN